MIVLPLLFASGFLDAVPELSELSLVDLSFYLRAFVGLSSLLPFSIKYNAKNSVS